MKKIIGIVLIAFTFYNFTNTTVSREAFVGHWVWKSQNQTFKVHFYKSYEMLKGDYEMVENVNGIERTIYKSNRIIDKTFNLPFGNAISGNTSDGKIFMGIIKDNVLLGDSIHGIKEGQLKLVLKSSKTIKWEVTPLISYRKKVKKTPENFTIPTDITLTKVLTH